MPTLNIISKPNAMPLDIVPTTRRLSSPIIVQPTYTFDVSSLYGYVDLKNEGQDTSISYLNQNKQNNIPDGTYLKESSTGTGLIWNNSTHKIDVSTLGYDSSAAHIDTSIYKILSASVAVGNSNNFYTDTNVSVPGASVSDVVSIGSSSLYSHPTSPPTVEMRYGWVSASDNVVIRRVCVSPGTYWTLNPDTIKILVFKY